MKIVAYRLKDYLGLWTYTDFQITHKAKILDYKTNGNLILYVIFEVASIWLDAVCLKFLKVTKPTTSARIMPAVIIKSTVLNFFKISNNFSIKFSPFFAVKEFQQRLKVLRLLL